jgi:hypothetical protein
MGFTRIRAREDKLPKESPVVNKLTKLFIQLDLKLQGAIIQAHLQHAW